MPVTNYTWDPVTDSVLKETDSAGQVTAWYTNEPSAYGPLLSQRRGDQTRHFHFDALGSTRQLTDDAGNVTDSFTYDAWGNEVARSGVSATKCRWVGQLGYLFESNVSGYDIRYRTFRPEDSSWITRDRAFPHDGLNGYVYVHRRPQQFVDPSGLECIACGSYAYYRHSIATLDALVMNRSFSLLANRARGGHAVSPWGDTIFGLPDTFSHTGAFFHTNAVSFADPTGFTVVPRGAKSAAYLFFVSFDVCETSSGDCRLFLDETGTTLTTYRVSSPPEVDYANSFNHGDITGDRDNMVDELRFRPPGSPCNKMMIYCDMPSLMGIMQGNGKMWATQVVHQLLQVKDASSGLAVVASFSHTVTIGVGPRREEIASP